MNPRRREVCAALGIAAWPALARAQAGGSAAVRRIAVLDPNRSLAMQARPEAARFLEQLHLRGWSFGANLAIDVRYAEGYVSRLPGLARELLAAGPELLLAVGNDAVAAARQASDTLPIVMAYVAEPVSAGFVADLSRPGGRVTGAAWLAHEVAGKMVEVLREAVPDLRRLAVLGNPAIAGMQAYDDAYRQAVAAVGIEPVGFVTRLPHEVDEALPAIAREPVQALFVGADPGTLARIEDIAAFTLRRRLPALGISPMFVDAGGLLYYGPDTMEVTDRVVSYVDRILRGARPADLPVEQPTRYEPVLNLRTARAMALQLPRSLLLRATRVIE